ncbi:ATP-dependent DNA helicase pif1 [Gigaspora margarita]|uniref:ATP-dependent DNA helicase pif1 n=1 Tax=Gigaspora margarita TaxID=4874 RepID=A0A8H3XAL2_GIGMA|nr:ATP-dependent DNA helicase pif1 [Gigaspora margarita]
MSDQNLSMKLIANMIIDSIEEGDGYTWVVKTAPHILTCYKNVGTFYFACSQLNKLAHDYKESNRPRIFWFNCHGMMVIYIDIPASKIIVNFKYEILYNRSVDVTTPIEIRQEIKENIHLDPVQLRAHLSNRFNISNITIQQIRYWWALFAQDFIRLMMIILIQHIHFLNQTKQWGVSSVMS